MIHAYFLSFVNEQLIWMTQQGRMLLDKLIAAQLQREATTFLDLEYSL
jgi:hypothetical protein